MKPLALALGAATLAAFAASIGLALYCGMPVQYLPDMVFDSFLITKMAIFLLLLLLGLAALLPNRQGQTSSLLTIVMGLALALGLLATLLDVSNTMRAVAATGTTNLKVYGPGLAEGLLPIAFGLLAGFVAALKARRPAKA